MEITAEMVKKLRMKTGAGIMASKKALEDSKGDFSKAEQVLQEQGLALAAKKAGRAITMLNSRKSINDFEMGVARIELA